MNLINEDFGLSYVLSKTSPFLFLPVQRDLPQFQSSLLFQLSLKRNINVDATKRIELTCRYIHFYSPEESLSYILNAILSLSSGPFASERFVASMNSFELLAFFVFSFLEYYKIQDASAP